MYTIKSLEGDFFNAFLQLINSCGGITHKDGKRTFRKKYFTVSSGTQ